MHARTGKNYSDQIAYYLRRAAEERGKAAEARSERSRLDRTAMAEIFEARAEALPTLH